MIYAVAAALWAASLLATLTFGMQIGEDRFKAERLRDIEIVAVASEAAASAAAHAIAGIEVRNVTINNELRREVETREVFRDCRSGAHATGLLNSTPGIAAPARPDTAASGVLPEARTAR